MIFKADRGSPCLSGVTENRNNESYHLVKVSIMANVVLGNIESITGTVTVVHKDGSSEALALDAQVYMNDVISTGKNAQVNIQLLDGSILKLDAGQTAVLDADLLGAAGSYTVASDDGSGLVTVSKVGIINSVQGDVLVIRDGQEQTLKAGDFLLAGDVLNPVWISAPILLPILMTICFPRNTKTS